MSPLKTKKISKMLPSRRGRIENSSMAVKWVFQLKKRRAVESNLKKQMKVVKKRTKQMKAEKKQAQALALKEPVSKDFEIWKSSVKRQPNLPPNLKNSNALHAGTDPVSKGDLSKNILDKEKLKRLLTRVVRAHIRPIKEKATIKNTDQPVQTVNKQVPRESFASDDLRIVDNKNKSKHSEEAHLAIPDYDVVDVDDNDSDPQVIPDASNEKLKIRGKASPEEKDGLTIVEVNSDHQSQSGDSSQIQQPGDEIVFMGESVAHSYQKKICRFQENPRKRSGRSIVPANLTRGYFKTLEVQKPPPSDIQDVIDRQKLKTLLLKVSQAEKSGSSVDDAVEVLYIRENAQKTKKSIKRKGHSGRDVAILGVGAIPETLQAQDTKSSKKAQNILDKQKLKNLLEKVTQLQEQSPTITGSVENQDSDCKRQRKMPGKNVSHSLPLSSDMSKSDDYSKSSLRDRMIERLNAARFRYINEQLYTTTGDEAMKFFAEDPDAFTIYHQGYESQLKKWPLSPMSLIIQDLKEKSSGLVIADFGCGDAKLAENLSNVVHSFDLVAINERVVACDMAKVPLENNAVDVVVFCLSLMGTNLTDFLMEANRVLKLGGLLKIAEVESRFENVEYFIKDLKKIGFTLLKKDLSHKMFFLFDFTKSHNCMRKKNLTFTLHPCFYKKR